ncbi:hypothetical protein LOTGIDRAFT_155688 [Lottia gigantea]|uniref:Uncharacterized protein n=1 Tax=Lottia gigantea TaxID=225164 RepID=V3ZEZ0_LOTGI|nr:hypothetical protein LOTGIDRAFT_155688 [Lottia gigantea]ESO82672.1 hypothetical protein LOTGIDRAFT_155688 [Lottia gigantea]
MAGFVSKLDRASAIWNLGWTCDDSLERVWSVTIWAASGAVGDGIDKVVCARSSYMPQLFIIFSCTLSCWRCEPKSADVDDYMYLGNQNCRVTSVYVCYLRDH